jgi:hypothetical protein
MGAVTVSIRAFCHYAECSNADCHVLFIALLNVSMLNVVCSINLGILCFIVFKSDLDVQQICLKAI